MSPINQNYIESILKQFDYYKLLGDKTIINLNEDELHWKYNDESNSIATIINHIVGNMLSRWTHFYEEDGEKSWRNRDSEFEIQQKSKEELVAHWEKGWSCLFKIIKNLNDDDLTKKIKIRGEEHSVIEAINRQLAHYPYHIGQIIHSAKMIKNDAFESLSIPKNKSEIFNKDKFDKKNT